MFFHSNTQPVHLAFQVPVFLPVLECGRYIVSASPCRGNSRRYSSSLPGIFVITLIKLSSNASVIDKSQVVSISSFLGKLLQMLQL